MVSGLSNSRLVDSGATRPVSAWREVEVLLLALLVASLYFSRLTDLTIRGEESRWARVAHEMVESGDWIVPRQQGEPFPDRPPLNSWAMILAAKLTGQLNLVAIRLPTVMATLLSTLLIYIYGRNFLSRMGSFAAALAYPTMAQVMQLGRVAESDALLTLCLSGALLSWHYAYSCRRNPALAWIAGYACAALAGLAKGPQGPVYFVAITSVFLTVRRDWRFLFSRWHLAGCTVFVLIVGLWQLPFSLALGASGARAVWSEGGQVGQRFLYSGFRRALERWGSYPFEVFGCMLPWSFMLPALATRWFRQNIGNARPMVVFLATACAIAFPTCWLPADSRPRYFMSLYPCVALLIGLVIERSWQSKQIGWWQRSWDHYLLCGAALMLGAGGAVGIARSIGSTKWLNVSQSLSPMLVLFYGFAAVAAACAVYWSRGHHSLARAQVGSLALAGFIGFSYSGVVLSVQAHVANDPSAAVVSVRALIPPGEQLVSLGPVHHLFAYYYREPIQLQKLSHRRAPASTKANYFCYVEDPKFRRPYIPFAWDPIAEISCERARSERPLTKVVVGKRRVSPAHDDEESAFEPFASSSIGPAGYREDPMDASDHHSQRAPF